MNIAKFSMIHKIAMLASIDINTFKQAIEQDIVDPVTSIGNLVYEALLQDKSYYQVIPYIDYLLSLFYQLYPNYTYEERQWIKFYVLLKAIGVNTEFAQLLYDEYHKLPNLNTTDQYLKLAQTSVINIMLSYYLFLDKDYSDLLIIRERNNG